MADSTTASIEALADTMTPQEIAQLNTWIESLTNKEVMDNARTLQGRLRNKYGYVKGKFRAIFIVRNNAPIILAVEKNPT